MKTVLLVDDDHLLVELLGIYLGRYDYVIELSHSFDEATAAIDNLTQLDAAVIDYQIGIGSIGLALFEKLLERFPAAQIIMISGHRREAILQSNDDVEFLQKPFHPKQLRELLEA